MAQRYENPTSKLYIYDVNGQDLRILFLIPYPTEQAASQRFRFEQYLDILESRGIKYRISPFLTMRAWNIIYRRGFILQKSFALLIGFLKRIWSVCIAPRYDFIFIHREVLPIGPPIFEWILAKILNRKIIYDFDDAIWILNSSESNRFFAALKWPSNVFKISQLAHKVSVGNTYLKNSLESTSDNIIVNPTTIDTQNLHKKVRIHDNDRIVMGWTGSHSTIKYLNPIFPIIKKLKNKFDFDFIVISDESPSLEKGLFEFIPWNKENEIDDLLRFNIGIMPLTHDPWSEGKCGFKALQYMALGIPAVVSPVGVNEEIVKDGLHGFVCRTEDEWLDKLSVLLRDRKLIIELGLNGRNKVVEQYSVQSNTPNFLHLFAQ